jgi:hypothetical protein
MLPGTTELNSLNKRELSAGLEFIYKLMDDLLTELKNRKLWAE